MRQDEDTRSFPTQPEIWESVIAVPAWQGEKLVEIKLYPITLGFGKPRTVRGRPMFAGTELGKKLSPICSAYPRRLAQRSDLWMELES